MTVCALYDTHAAPNRCLLKVTFIAVFTPAYIQNVMHCLLYFTNHKKEIYKEC